MKTDDLVIFLGDYQVLRKEKHPISETLSQMNGDFTFIMGNHDWNNADGLSPITSLTLAIGGVNVFCVHDPMDFDATYPINLVGHVHGNWKIKTLPNKAKLVNVSVDAWDFYPVDIQDIIKLIARDEIRYQKEKEKEMAEKNGVKK